MSNVKISTFSDATTMGSSDRVTGLQGGANVNFSQAQILVPIKGTILPSSVYLGGATGLLFPNFYIPATNTNGAGALDGIGVVGSLGSDANAVLQFNMPEVIPSGTLKLRLLAMANATSGVAKLTVKDKNVAAGASLGTSTLNSETQTSQTWATADILVENKVTLTSTPTANDILTVVLNFNTSGWTLTAQSTWQATIVWE